MAMTSPGHQRVGGRVGSFGYTLGSGIGKIPVAMGLRLAFALFVPGVNLP